MRKRIIAGNWKMHMNVQQSEAYAKQLVNLSYDTKSTDVLVFPTSLSIDRVSQTLAQSSIIVGCQNVHFMEEGAYTGEISAQMALSAGASYSLIGHSERREYFQETGEELLQKTQAVLSAGMKAILCCGEKLEQREANNHFKVVEKQVSEVLFKLNENDLYHMVIAYEPVWAIGTGVTASAHQAEEMHAFIRKMIDKELGKDIADQMHILYGGSVKPNNAQELFSQANIDGGLIGGASLKLGDFKSIIESMS